MWLYFEYSDIDLVGTLASKVIAGAGALADQYTNIQDQNAYLRITKVVSTITEFDQIALRISVESTLAHKFQLIAMKGARVEDDWRSMMGSVVGGIEQMMTDFLKVNETKAKLLGRADGQKVILYLQQEAVAENLGVIDAVDMTRFSAVAGEICSELDLKPSDTVVASTTPTTTSTEGVIHQGIMQKRGSFIPYWHTRKFILKAGVLEYFAVDASTGQLTRKGGVQIMKTTKIMDCSYRLFSHCFNIHNGVDTHPLSCDSAESKEAWMASLKGLVNSIA